MMCQPDRPRNGGHDETRFPALGRLRLAAGDFAELAKQGFVSTEACGLQTRFKLRFRRAGCQVVRYIRGAEEAVAVTAELEQLQAARRLRRKLADLNREASRLLRESKTCLQPLVEANGFKFHGRQVRRPRRPSVESRR